MTGFIDAFLPFLVSELQRELRRQSKAIPRDRALYLEFERDTSGRFVIASHAIGPNNQRWVDHANWRHTGPCECTHFNSIAYVSGANDTAPLQTPSS